MSSNGLACDLRIMTYNIMRDQNYETHPVLQWQAREKRIKAVILDAHPDIVCLQEAKDLYGQPIEAFLQQFEAHGYAHLVHSGGPLPSPSSIARTFSTPKHMSHHSFRTPPGFPPAPVPTKQLKLAVLWKPSRVKMIRSFTMILDNCSTQGRKLNRPVGADLFEIGPKESRNFLWVFHTHLGYTKEQRQAAINELPSFMERLSSKTPCVLLGDFNFFDEDGKHQLNHLCRGTSTFQMKDLGSDAVYETSGHPAKGTYIGCSMDPWCPPFGHIGPRLDFILAKDCSLFSGDKARVWNKTMLEREPAFLQVRDVFPSDHLPVVADIKLTNCT